MKDDFRVGDRVYYHREGLVEPSGLYIIKEIQGDEVALIYDSGESRHYGFKDWVEIEDIFHDHDRKISAAVQKAIEENETKPVRKVKRWVNLFIAEHDMRCFFEYETKEKALEIAKNDGPWRKFILIAQEIEIEEDKL